MAEVISFGEWVQNRRNQLCLTRKGLAELAACSPVTIKKIERDERRPSPQIAELLARHLQLPQSEHENFMARARGAFVSNFISPTELSIEEAQAPASEDERPRHNLPHQPTPFFGRAQELAEIARQLANPNCRLLTILGAGGMGKTRLSIEAARAQVGNFTDGITFVELAPIDSNRSEGEINPLASVLADALGLGFHGESPPEQQLSDYLGVISFCVTAALCEEKSTDGLSTDASFEYAFVSCQPASLTSQHSLPSQAEIEGGLPLAAVGLHVW